MQTILIQILDKQESEFGINIDKDGFIALVNQSNNIKCMIES